MDLRSLVAKQDISEREEAGLEIFNGVVGIQDEEQRMSVSIGVKGWLSVGIYLANRKGTVRNKHVVGK